MKIIICSVLFLIFAISNSYPQQEGVNFAELNGAYLGQKPPGNIPEVFSPGIVSVKSRINHSPLAVSPDGSEVFWSVVNPFEVFYMKSINGKWTKPVKAPFTNGLDASSPVFSPDGKRVYFASQVVVNKKWTISLWYSEKAGEDWTKPIPLDTIINNGHADYQVSASNDGTIYFSTEDNPEGKGSADIYVSRYVNGKHSKPVNLGDSINTAAGESRVYVAPDESYLLFSRYTRVPRGIGMCMDFYVSYKNPDGSWTKAIEFGDLLGEKSSSGWINVSPDGKYIFFTSIFPGRVRNLYWVSSAILESLKPKRLKK